MKKFFFVFCKNENLKIKFLLINMSTEPVKIVNAEKKEKMKLYMREYMKNYRATHPEFLRKEYEKRSKLYHAKKAKATDVNLSRAT